MCNRDFGSVKTQKRNKTGQHMKVKAKQTNKKIRVFGQPLTRARIGLRMHNQACVHKQDYAYADFCPKILKTQKRSRTSKREF